MSGCHWEYIHGTIRDCGVLNFKWICSAIFKWLKAYDSLCTDCLSTSLQIQTIAGIGPFLIIKFIFHFIDSFAHQHISNFLYVLINKCLTRLTMTLSGSRIIQQPRGASNQWYPKNCQWWCVLIVATQASQKRVTLNLSQCFQCLMFGQPLWIVRI